MKKYWSSYSWRKNTNLVLSWKKPFLNHQPSFKTSQVNHLFKSKEKTLKRFQAIVPKEEKVDLSKK